MPSSHSNLFQVDSTTVQFPINLFGITMTNSQKSMLRHFLKGAGTGFMHGAITLTVLFFVARKLNGV